MDWVKIGSALFLVAMMVFIFPRMRHAAKNAPKGTSSDWMSFVLIIAAVAGFALGGGCELAMMCDFIIAADTAKFGQPEINLGIVAGIGGTQRLTRLVGKSKSMDMHLTGRFMDAVEAERAGLVSRVVPAKKLMDEAQAAAHKIAEKSTLTTMVVKETVNRSYETTLREGILFERRMFHALFASEDQTEGMTAFLEKREPQFRGK